MCWHGRELLLRREGVEKATCTVVKENGREVENGQVGAPTMEFRVSFP